MNLKFSFIPIFLVCAFGATWMRAADPAPFPIWKSGVMLAKAEILPEISNVEFHVIKKWDKKSDGYTFLHGVGLGQHKGKLYASFGHNKGAENTVSEEAHLQHLSL
jgi:hypothetical protein